MGKREKLGPIYHGNWGACGEAVMVSSVHIGCCQLWTTVHVVRGSGMKDRSWGGRREAFRGSDGEPRDAGVAGTVGCRQTKGAGGLSELLETELGGQSGLQP